MYSLAASLCLVIGAGLLAALSVIDLRERILPDKLVLPFALTGLAFNFFTSFVHAALPDMALGAVLGGGLLLTVRVVANYFYKTDALGLGDVKLLAAAGIWLGPSGVLMAIVAGALAGIAQGLAMMALEWRKTDVLPAMNRFSLPAGPGFAVGIVIAAIYAFWHFNVLMTS